MGGSIVMADLGRADKCVRAGVPTLKTTEYLKSSCDCYSKGGGGDSDTTSKKRFHLDICSNKARLSERYRDTDPEPQLQKAHSQHADLVQNLIRSGHQSGTSPSFPSSSATPYGTRAPSSYERHTLDNMQAPGIQEYPSNTQPNSASKMHYQAIKFMNNNA